MFEDAGAPLVSARASQVVLAGALALGLGEEDSAALIAWYRRRAAATVVPAPPGPGAS